MGIEVSHNSKGLFLSQSEYASDLLVKAAMTYYKPIASPIATKSSMPSDDIPFLILSFIEASLVLYNILQL